MMMRYQALRLDAMGYAPASPSMLSALKVKPRFGEMVNLGRVEDGLVVFPRGMAGIGPDTIDARSAGTPIYYGMVNSPRNTEQTRVIQDSSQRLLLGVDHILRATTGFGKTFCALSIAANVGVTTLVVVTKEDLMHQWRKAILEHTTLKEEDIGRVQQDECSYKGKKIVLGMVHSLVKDKYPAALKDYFGLVIFDEVHRMGAETFQLSCGMFTAKHRLGLSATPTRVDGKEFIFEAHIGPVEVSSGLLQVPPKVVMQKTGFRLPLVVRRINGKWLRVPLPHEPARMMNVYKAMSQDRDRNLMIVNFVKRAYDKGRNIIVFSDLKEMHLQPLCKLAGESGIPKADMSFYVGGMSEAARSVAKTKRVLWATYAMTSEATDIPWLDTAVLATPRANIVQTIGRVLREWPDKKQPLIYDLVDPCSGVLEMFASKRRTTYHRMEAELLNV